MGREDEVEAKPFGRRRPHLDVPASRRLPTPPGGMGHVGAMREALLSAQVTSSGSFRRAALTAAAFGFLAVLAVQALSRMVAPSGLPVRIAQVHGMAEPETTGALASPASARAVRLDPCTAAAVPR